MKHVYLDDMPQLLSHWIDTGLLIQCIAMAHNANSHGQNNNNIYTTQQQAMLRCELTVNEKSKTQKVIPEDPNLMKLYTNTSHKYVC